MNEPRFTRKTLLIGGGMLAVLVLISLSPTLVGLVIPHFHGAAYEPPQPVEDFTLQRADGGTLRLSEQRGSVVVLYFGYTSCPDVCPTTLYDLHRALDLLGERADDLVVGFVTIDPDTDTPEQLATYVAVFDPRFIGLTGTPDALQTAYDRFGVTVLQDEDTAETYGLAHTNSVFVVDRAGRLRLRMHFGAKPEEMASDLLVLLKERGA